MTASQLGSPHKKSRFKTAGFPAVHKRREGKLGYQSKFTHLEGDKGVGGLCLA